MYVPYKTRFCTNTLNKDGIWSRGYHFKASRRAVAPIPLAHARGIYLAKSECQHRSAKHAETAEGPGFWMDAATDPAGCKRGANAYPTHEKIR